MFQEHHEQQARQYGWMEVIAGSMFSGKTEELIRRAKRAEIAKLSVQLFKPMTDNRFADAEVVSHDRSALSCVPVDSSAHLLILAQGYQVVGVDEAQFFDDGIVEVCNQLANQGIRVIIAGLDMDSEGRPFGPMPNLMATAEYVTKVHAICARSGSPAHYSHRLDQSNDAQVQLGEVGDYEPLSRAEFNRTRQKV